VEDDETPEAIMKKFEALERVQHGVARPAAEADGGASGSGEGAAATAGGGEQQMLTEEQLQELFKQTSMFTVRSALAGLEFMHGGHGACARVCRSPLRLIRACGRAALFWHCVADCRFARFSPQTAGRARTTTRTAATMNGACGGALAPAPASPPALTRLSRRFFQGRG
jgi:hypothetical protein